MRHRGLVIQKMCAKQELFYVFSIFIILLGVLHNASASQALFFARLDPDKPDQCIFEDEVHKVGQVQIKGECGLIDCSRDCTCAITGCGTASAVPPCYTVEDKSKPYPDCCAQPVCPEENALR
uniref:CSON006114 protein n=2 Tax=Culicoides sonorensis TaxID=179676 RepID=A0A336LZV8_CULSO